MASPVVVALVAITSSVLAVLPGQRPAPLLAARHPLEQLGDVKVLRVHAVDRGQRAAEHVVAAVELPGALDRDHVARLLHHTDDGALATPVLADPAGRLDGEIKQTSHWPTFSLTSRIASASGSASSSDALRM